MRTIAELTKERLRQAGRKIREEHPQMAQISADKERNEMICGKSASSADKPLPDLGFRIFKLDASNIQAWEPIHDNLEQALQLTVEHLRTDRTEADILYELLLKLGLDLCVPIEQKKIHPQMAQISADKERDKNNLRTSASSADKSHTVYSIGGGV